MLDEKDLQDISKIMDEKIAASEQRMMERITESEQRMTEKIAGSEQRMTRYMGVLIENEVTPKFNLLADALAEMREMLVTPARVEKIENEQQMQKAVIRQMAGRLSRLEKAN